MSELFVKLSPKKQKTNRKNPNREIYHQNFTCDLCVCEHISESRYFTSTPHASKNIKTPTGPPTTTGAIKAARVGISHHLLRNVILAKTSSTTWPCHLQKYFPVSPSIFWGGYQWVHQPCYLLRILPGFTINILGRISVGPSFISKRIIAT